MKAFSDLRPPRVRCARCRFRFELIVEPLPTERVFCPRCRSVVPPTQEPLDEAWWTWATRRPVEPRGGDARTPRREEPQIAAPSRPSPKSLRDVAL
jgi:hypothetical protein